MWGNQVLNYVQTKILKLDSKREKLPNLNNYPGEGSFDISSVFKYFSSSFLIVISEFTKDLVSSSNV